MVVFFFNVSPSTTTSQFSGSNLLPRVRTTLPSTETRPSVINSSAFRRLATPASAMIFCKRCSIRRKGKPRTTQLKNRAPHLAHPGQEDGQPAQVIQPKKGFLAVPGSTEWSDTKSRPTPPLLRTLQPILC